MHGQNFLLDREGSIASFGFYQNILIEGENLRQVKLMATSKIWHDQELKEITLNPDKDPPKISLESYWELDSSDFNTKQPVTDRTYYKEKKWWQFWK